jgi:ABC-type transport system substrate-binding protein
MRWCNAAVDRLEREALAATSRAVRRRLYSQIGAIAAQQVPILYLYNAAYVYAYRKRLRGFAPNAFLPTWNAYGWSLTDKAAKS